MSGEVPIYDEPLLSEGSTHSLKPPLHNSSSPREKEPKELEKLRKWQEERIQRRLRGEYESALLHLQEVVSIF